MPIPTDELKKLKQVKKGGGSRIGTSDPLLQDLVKIINEFPKRVTLTGIAETLHMRGRWLDVKESNLKSRLRRRLDILTNTTDRTGQPALKQKSELRVDSFGETDGTIRYIWYLPQHEEDIMGERTTISEFQLLLSPALEDQPQIIQSLFVEYFSMFADSREVHDAEGWKITFWKYIRQNIDSDPLWVQLYAAELGVEQDVLMQKRLIRRFSTIIDEIWSNIE